MSKSTCGIFCESEKSDVTAIYLPLVEVRVEASIVDGTFTIPLLADG